MRTRFLGLMVASAVALAMSACGGRSDGAGDNPGITDDEVVIGISYPLTGPQSAFANGARALEAYAAHVNAEGGIEMGDGVTRDLRVVTYDDAYDPAKTVTGVRRLVERDNVFAVHNLLGTPTQLAVIDYLNAEKVPDVFAGSVAGEWTQNADTYPWTAGFQPTLQIEARIYAQAIIEEDPAAKVAVLYQNDDTGIPALETLEETFADTGVEIARAESYEVSDATVDSQIAALASSGANYFINLTGPKAAAQSISRAAELEWRPKQYLFSVSTSIPTVLEPAGLEAASGIYSAEWLKVPGDARWNDDEGLNEFREIMAEHGDGIDVEDRLTVYGYTAARALVGALEQTPEPTREAFMDTVRNLSLEIPTLIPGVTIDTDAENVLPVRQMQLQQFDGTSWSVLGDVIDGSD